MRIDLNKIKECKKPITMIFRICVVFLQFFSRSSPSHLFTYQFVTITNDAKDIYFPFPFLVCIRRFFCGVLQCLLSTSTLISTELEIGKKNFFFLSHFSWFRLIWRRREKKTHAFIRYLKLWVFFLSGKIITTNAPVARMRSQQELVVRM